MSRGTNLRLIANDSDASVIHKREESIGIMSGQELCGDGVAIHIHAHR